MRRADIEVPNRAADMNSQARSACYPQSTFYPLSDGPSMRYHRITNACFRNCSTCRSYSKAPLCVYTLRLVSNQPEGTFAHLSYSEGSWGLSVLLRVEGIFTPVAISLSLRSRQCGCCYAIRAGRNLPDKEFRYLRTVIVTAAVYWGFGSLLRVTPDRFP